MRRLPAAVALLLPLLSACGTPLLDSPSKTRVSQIPLAPGFSWLVDWRESPDGSSYSWSALLWLLGQDVEGDRRHARALPFYWHDDHQPYMSQTLLFPLYYSRDWEGAAWRSYGPLWTVVTDEAGWRSDHVVLDVFDWKRSDRADSWRSGLFLVYDWEHRDGVEDIRLVPLIGMSFPLAHLAHLQFGLPAAGETVGALGREASRRIEVLDVLKAFTLFGYDDVGDRTEWRLVTLFGAEFLSFARSWRGRGDDPFVSEWVFPLYMHMADAQGGWYYVGPLWGEAWDVDAGTTTDWWLAGVLSRTTAPEGNTWRVLGLPVSSP